MNFTKNQMSLIIGSVLGDGYITKHTRHGLPVLDIAHSEKQIEYLKWKMDLFSQNGFKVSKLYDVSRKYKEYRCRVHLGEYGVLLRHSLYPNDNKTISRHFLNYLTPQGLAIWYMDDGSKAIHYKNGICKSREIHILTYCFSYDEHEIFVKYFKNVWDIDVKIHKDRKYYRLAMNATNANKFINIIKPYMCPSMLYKIDLGYKNPTFQDASQRDEGIVQSL